MGDEAGDIESFIVLCQYKNKQNVSGCIFGKLLLHSSEYVCKIGCKNDTDTYISRSMA